MAVEELKDKLAAFLSKRLYQIIISNPRNREAAFKVKIRPLLVKGELCFQETRWVGTQVFHENYKKEEMLDKILSDMETFKQLEAQSMDERLTVLVSKKGKLTMKCQRTKPGEAKALPDMAHNRTKQYLLQEGIPVPFLVDLGVQTAEGVIVKSRYNKFKQINRYLEFVEDVLPVLEEKKRMLHIIDFGCGKSYLTFALYYYLHELKKLDVMITGLDLKTDIINECNRLAAGYGYDRLKFVQGDISSFTGAGQVDMVVTLHACDTATDYAIKKAVDWGADVIFTVPCCQHEVNRQLQNELFSPMLKYGLLKERMAALLTDAIRANLLEAAGYDTQVLEFIDMEHTPKNILIRAVKNKKRMPDIKTAEELKQMTDACHVEAALQRLMRNGKEV